jgi:hypothetical protein
VSTLLEALTTSGFEEPRKSKANPWAICTASVGREDKAKYERCVRKVKKRLGMR